MKRRSDINESLSSVRTSGETDSGVSVGEMIQRHAVEQQYGATGPGSRDVGVQMKTKYLIQKPRYLTFVRDVGTQTIERGHREMYNPRIISTYSAERLRQNCIDKNYSCIYDRQNYDVYRIMTKSKTNVDTESKSFSSRSDYTQKSNTTTSVSETDTCTTIENSYEISRADMYSDSDVYSVSDDDVNTRTVAVQMSTKYLVEEERPKSIVRDVGVQVRPSPIAALAQQSSPLIDQLWKNKIPLSRNVTCSLPEKLPPCESISDNSSWRSSIYENKKANSFSSFRFGYRVRRNLSHHSPEEKSKNVTRSSIQHGEKEYQYIFDHDYSVVRESCVNLQNDERGKRILGENPPFEEYTSIPIINDRKTNPLVLRGPDDITSGYKSESETSLEVVDSLPPVPVELHPTPTEKVFTSRYSYAPKEPAKYNVNPEKYHDKLYVSDIEENNPTVKIGPELDVVKAEFTESPPPIVPIKHVKPPPAPDVLIRVGGGWMKEEHHRIQHRPLQNKLVPTSDRIPFMRSSFFYNKSKLPVVNKQRKQTDKLRYASFIA